MEVEGGKAEEVARPPTWVLSRRLPLYWHKALVWGHLAVINLVAWFFGGYYAASTNGGRGAAGMPGRMPRRQRTHPPHPHGRQPDTRLTPRLPLTTHPCVCRNGEP